MQSLIDKANQGGYYMPQEQQTQHWEYQWHSPPKEHLHQGPAAAASASAAPASTNDGEIAPETYPFQYKTWVPTARPAQEDTNETVKPLDLSQYERSKYTSNNNGLTEDDIRGAVGGTEAIPGLSASTDANTAAEEVTKAPAPAVETAVEPIAETAMEPVEAAPEQPVEVAPEQPAEVATEQPVAPAESEDVEMKD